MEDLICLRVILLNFTGYLYDPGMPGEIQTSISLKEVITGTEITIIQEGIPAAIPLEYCYLGWQESLTQLAFLVEPEVKD